METRLANAGTAPVTIDDKYALDHGRVFMSGVQALVRATLDRHRADSARGLRTAGFISGYQGSPLGTFDKELARLGQLGRDHEIVHSPGLNEELAATAVWGSQLTNNLPGARYDGVAGTWYGKAPGLDRACDAIRHGNFVGASPTGGVLALVGDDPSSKSSTLPSASEATLASLHVPTLFPGNLQELLEFGLHGYACSRAAGTWVAMKVVTDVADGAGTALVGPDRVAPALPTLEWEGRPYEHRPSGHLLAPESLAMERTLFEVRLPLAKLYARLNRLNRVTGSLRAAWLGIVTAGKTYYDLRQALDDLGIDDRALERAGVRILKLGMLFPLDEQIVREFGGGLDEVLVLEEKQPFIEPAIRDALYGVTGAPRVLGKRDEAGRPLVTAEGSLDSDAIARVVAARLAQRVELPSVAARLERLEALSSARSSSPATLKRTPFFCSGCPHNRSTAAPDGSLVGVGIGCHTMVLLAPEGKGELTGLTQMGAEGTQWIGMAPFTDSDHFIQNMGDGTFHHSGSLAIRYAVAAGVNVTYKLLYNDAVAMTGGQAVQGVLAVPELTKLLELEGVKRTIVTTDDPGKYGGIELASNAEVRDRRELAASQDELAAVPGVTVLLHDQQCAAEKRRLRKRGKLVDPPTRVHINERVCEGCGDCGKKSSCLSVQPVETEFGRKTRIHQASCNKDYSCLDGDCPSFLTVVPGKARERGALPPVPCELPDPVLRVPADDLTIRMPGVGGTGVVTISQIIGMAALLDGKHAWGLDQTGLSQKGGPVVSDVRISDRPIDGSNRASAGSADLYLGFDLLGATAPENLATADPARTVAVVSTSAVPTGRMVIDPSIGFPGLTDSLDALESATRAADNFYLDAQALSELLFDDSMPANALLLGAAYQRGALPLSEAAIEQAFRLNGAGVEKNLAAFAWGRACVVSPDAIHALSDPQPAPTHISPEAAALAARVEGGGELRRLLEVRVPELIAYQDERWAARYVDAVREVAGAEQERTPGRSDVAEAFARNLYKLMSYKDEYEVARLHLDAAERARVREEFGDGAKVYWHLHPPLLRALGLKRKLKLGSWFAPAFRALRALKRLRGTAFDPFGYARVRRVERGLIGEYESAVEAALVHLRPETHATVVEVCEAPDMVRGYEEIKLAGVERYRSEVERLTRLLSSGAARPPAAAVLTLPMATSAGS